MFEELLKRIGAVFEKHALPYMVIGGQAVLLYGEPRLTRDIDITLGVDTSKLDMVLKIVTELDLHPLPQDVQSFVRQTMVLPACNREQTIRVDLIFSFTPYEQQAITRARTVCIKKQDVKFASPEDIIIHKIFAGRPRDLEDARIILIKNPDMDKNYILTWLQRFDVSEGSSFFVKTYLDLDIAANK